MDATENEEMVLESETLPNLDSAPGQSFDHTPKQSSKRSMSSGKPPILSKHAGKKNTRAVKLRRTSPGTHMYGTKSRYTEQQLAEALDNIKSGKMAIKQAARNYGIPRNTLKNKLKGNHNKSVGRPTVFTTQEEDIFKGHIKAVSDMGLPISMYDVRCIVRNYLNAQKRKVAIFQNNMPGWDWGEGFLHRHPDIKNVVGQNGSRKRAQVDGQIINNFFDNLEKELEGVPPQNVWNYDESGFHDNPRKSKHLFQRGVRHLEIIRNSTKSCYTIMFCANALGEVLPPYFIIKGTKKVTGYIMQAPKGSRMNVLRSGWMDMANFKDWFEYHLLPRLKRQEGKKVVIGDNLSSHLSPLVLRKAQENDVAFVFLVPNSTHILQPLDVGMFAPLKTQWRIVLEKWRNTPQGKVSVSMPNYVFSCLIKRTLHGIKENVATNIQAAFKATGICPLNREHVLAKLPIYTNPDSSQNWPDLVGEHFKNYIYSLRSEDLVPSQRGRTFQMPVQPGKSVSLEEVEEYVKNRLESKQNGKPKKSNTSLKSSHEASGEKRQKTEKSTKRKSKKQKINETEDTEDEMDYSGYSDNDEVSEDINRGYVKDKENGNEKEEKTKQEKDKNKKNELSVQEGTYVVDKDGVLRKEDSVAPSESDSVEKLHPYTTGDYVIIQYEGSYFPGTVTGIVGNQFMVSAMSLHRRNWRWPDHKDELLYDICDIIKTVGHENVVPVNNRGDFAINDDFLNKKWFSVPD